MGEAANRPEELKATPTPGGASASVGADAKPVTGSPNPSPTAPPSGQQPVTANQPSGQPVPPALPTKEQRERAAAGAKASEAKRDAVATVSKAVDMVAQELSRVTADVDDSEFLFVGSPGGRFRIDGVPRQFGTNGTVTLNGKPLHAFAWSSMRVEGNLPADAKPGEVVVIVDSDTRYRGRFRG